MVLAKIKKYILQKNQPSVEIDSLRRLGLCFMMEFQGFSGKLSLCVSRRISAVCNVMTDKDPFLPYHTIFSRVFGQIILCSGVL